LLKKSEECFKILEKIEKIYKILHHETKSNIQNQH